MGQIQPVLLDSREAHQGLLMENGRHSQHIQDVRGTPVRVIQQNEIPRVEILATHEVHHLLQTIVIAPREYGQARCFGQQPALVVINAQSEVMNFVDDGAVGSTNQVALHFPRSRQQIVVDDFNQNGISTTHAKKALRKWKSGYASELAYNARPGHWIIAGNCNATIQTHAGTDVYLHISEISQQGHFFRLPTAF